MRLQNVIQKQLRRLSFRFPSLRHFSIISAALTLAWLYALYRGERSAYRRHIEACHWDQWEEWPREAAPHRAVLIADPQLVDPHTYPGRPWPLSTLTERYTDLYMQRNYRLINERLDPDSIIFLGDLFDGGREWAPDKARKLKTSQRKRLEQIGVLAKQEDKKKRDLESYNAAVDKDHLNVISKEEPEPKPKIEENSKTFIPGENGRWSKWTGKQWEQDFDRFSRIFFAPEQLYPQPSRKLFAAYDVAADPISIENGAKDVTSQEYATTGGKSRQVIASLPGNHDLGFGAGVQIVVRDRFESRFGSGNRIDVLGNHTFLSLDTPSLSAHNQFMSNGYESEQKDFEPLKHIWKPSMDFLNNLRHPAGKAVQEALGQYYPREHSNTVWNHQVTEAGDVKNHPSLDKLVQEALAPKPKLPVILLSHVPLYRNPDTDCGPLRERGGALTLTFGYQYQNVLTQTLSRDIVSKIYPIGDLAAIFSGDDHDYCDVPHRYNVAAMPSTNPMDTLKTRLAQIREITVKSFSWAMGVRKPGFQMVSLWNPVDAQGNTVGIPLPTVQTHLCLLPDQLSIFIDYALLFLLTLPLLFVRAVYITIKSGDSTSAEDSLLSLPMVTLPHFESSANGHASPEKRARSKGRHRASSTSTSSHKTNHNGYLGVQRSYNARTRSVSPSYGAGSGSQQTGGALIDKAGYFPQVRWTDPSDVDSDEESNVGTDVGWSDDSQAKWKWRRRTPGRARKALDEFGKSLLVVGVPGAVWYFYLIRNG